MNIFMDTAAFLATLNVKDQFYPLAKNAWNEIVSSDTVIFSSNYVILETTALLQHRFGIDAVRLFENDVFPILVLIWVDETIHKQAISSLLAANRRDLSLVDCTSFAIMRQNGLDNVFTFDPHFSEQGFIVIPQ